MLRPQQGLLEVEGDHGLLELEKLLKQVQELHCRKKLPVIPKVCLILYRDLKVVINAISVKSATHLNFIL